MQPFYGDNDVTLFHGECREVLPRLPAASVDAVVCDPPYPGIERDYGTWTEADWHDLMRDVVAQLRRVLTPAGSALFVLQPNSVRLGSMRPWLWDFLGWASREWNVVQDAYWWNIAAMPGERAGLLRQSLKTCVWLGAPECYRDEVAVLWSESQGTAARRLADRARGASGTQRSPSGHRVRRGERYAATEARGGVSPFNVLPIPNTRAAGLAGALGHGAGTPDALCEWWIKYLTPPGGTVLYPFAGSGTTLRAAKQLGRRAIGIETVADYCAVAAGTLRQQMLPLAV